MPAPKFTAEQVLQIHKRLAQGESRLSLSRAFKVNKETICRIARGETYQSVDEIAVLAIQQKDAALNAEMDRIWNNAMKVQEEINAKKDQEVEEPNFSALAQASQSQP